MAGSSRIEDCKAALDFARDELRDASRRVEEAVMEERRKYMNAEAARANLANAESKYAHLGFQAVVGAGMHIKRYNDLAASGQHVSALVSATGGEAEQGAQLHYGWGNDPFCNLTDGAGLAVPAFGPSKIPKPTR